MDVSSPRIQDHATLLRIGALLVVIPQIVAAMWAFLAPRSFWESFPGFGRAWVSPVGPFNEHFIVDTGNLLLVMSVLLLVSVYYLERRWVRISLVMWLLFAVPHFISHIRLANLFEGIDNAGQLGSLGLGVLLPLLLLLLTYRSDRTVAGSTKPLDERAM